MVLRDQAVYQVGEWLVMPRVQKPAAGAQHLLAVATPAGLEQVHIPFPRQVESVPNWAGQGAIRQGQHPLAMGATEDERQSGE